MNQSSLSNVIEKLSKGQSMMVNPKTLATLDTQYTERTQQNIKYNTDN